MTPFSRRDVEVVGGMLEADSSRYDGHPGRAKPGLGEWTDEGRTRRGGRNQPLREPRPSTGGRAKLTASTVRGSPPLGVRATTCRRPSLRSLK